MLFMMIIIVLALMIGLFFYLKSRQQTSHLKMSTQYASQRFIQQYQKHFTESYILLNDYSFVDPHYGMTQIDHIILSPYGIFVVEIKSSEGYIFVDEQQKLWTQLVKKKKYQFQNLLHKNAQHIHVLEHILKDFTVSKNLYSLIVFTPQCEFKTPTPANILRGESWVQYIQTFNNIHFSEQELGKIKQHLTDHCLKPIVQTEQLIFSQLSKNKPTL